MVLPLRDALEAARVADGKKLSDAALLPEEGASSTSVERTRSRISASPTGGNTCAITAPFLG